MIQLLRTRSVVNDRDLVGVDGELCGRERGDRLERMRAGLERPRGMALLSAVRPGLSKSTIAAEIKRLCGNSV